MDIRPRPTRWIAFAGLALPLMALYAASPVTSSPERPGQAWSYAFQDDWNQIPQGNQTAGLNRAFLDGLFGQTRYAKDGTVSGRFFSFNFQESTGLVRSTLIKDGNRTATHFESITPQPLPGPARPFVVGASFHAPTQNLSFVSHNDPTALMTWVAHADGINLTFTYHRRFAPPSEAGADTKVFTDGLHGHILTTSTTPPTLQGRNVTYHLDRDDVVLFRYHPTNSGLPAANLHEFNGALLNGTLGALHWVVVDGSIAIEDRHEFDVALRARTVSLHRLVLGAENKGQGGRLVVLVVGSNILPMANLTRVEVRVDGTRSAEAPTAADVLAGGALAHSVVAVDKGVQLALWLPETGEHEVELLGIPKPPGKDGLPGPGHLVFALSLATATILWARRSASS